MIEYIIAIGMVFAAALFGYKTGKTKEKANQQEELVHVIEDVRKARDNLNDPAYLKRLLRKYG